MAREKDLGDFKRVFIIGTWMTKTSVRKTSQLASVSTGSGIKVTSGFRSMGKTSLNTAGNWLWKMYSESVMLIHYQNI